MVTARELWMSDDKVYKLFSFPVCERKCRGEHVCSHVHHVYLRLAAYGPAALCQTLLPNHVYAYGISFQYVLPILSMQQSSIHPPAHLDLNTRPTAWSMNSLPP